MIMSNKHKFIFIKTRKTAGTSIELALSKFCGPSDTITPTTEADEELRKEIGGIPPQHYNPVTNNNWLTRQLKRLLNEKNQVLYNHIDSNSIKDIIGKEKWNNYFKFTVERNPWDKAVSLYFWRTKNMKESPTFEEFIKNIDPLDLSNWHLYTTNNNIAVDYVIQYSNLENDLSFIKNQLQLDEDIVLPNSKSGIRKRDTNHASFIYGKEKDIINSVCGKEIAYFGYTY